MLKSRGFLEENRGKNKVLISVTVYLIISVAMESEIQPRIMK
jgi:hypothetical protein